MASLTESIIVFLRESMVSERREY